MTWQTTYPTLATVMEAGLQTLMTWDEMLPPPQTDVERTIRRRIKAQQHAVAGAELRATAPELADKMNDLAARIEKLTGQQFPRWP